MKAVQLEGLRKRPLSVQIKSSFFFFLFSSVSGMLFGLSAGSLLEVELEEEDEGVVEDHQTSEPAVGCWLEFCGHHVELFWGHQVEDWWGHQLMVVVEVEVLLEIG